MGEKEVDIRDCKDCPSCKKKMGIVYNDFMGYQKRGEVCKNEECPFYGIKRVV